VPIARRIKEARGAFKKMMHFMKHQVSERRAELRGHTESLTRRDAFTMLVKANENESGKYRLDDEELVCHLVDGGSPFSDCSKR
jgi:cytochrome P450